MLKRISKNIIWLFVVIVSLITIAWFVIFISYRISLYSNDVSLDYLYNFENTNVIKKEIKIENGKIVLPDIQSDSFTYILRVKIESGLSSFFFSPQVMLKSGGNKLVQVFEHSSKGDRFLNITDFKTEKGNEVFIKTTHADLSEDHLMLFVFPKVINETNILTKRILVLAPHPDDAEIASFGLYSTCRDSYVITVTAGEGGDKTYDELFINDSLHSIEKGKIRVWNSITTPLYGKVKINHVFNLGYFDSTLKDMYQEPNKNVNSKLIGISDVNIFRSNNITDFIDVDGAQANWTSLVGDMKKIVEKVQPDIIVTPHPIMDAHPDHVYTTRALSQAISELNYNNGYVFFYTNHCHYSKSYPFGEKGQPITLPPSYDDRVLFYSLYSFNLPIQKQKEKLLALDTMNDLRLDTEWIYVGGIIDKALSGVFNLFRGKNNSYFRRSVRENELYYVVNTKDLSKFF